MLDHWHANKRGTRPRYIGCNADVCTQPHAARYYWRQRLVSDAPNGCVAYAFANALADSCLDVESVKAWFPTVEAELTATGAYLHGAWYGGVQSAASVLGFRSALRVPCRATTVRTIAERCFGPVIVHVAHHAGFITRVDGIARVFALGVNQRVDYCIDLYGNGLR